MTIEERALYNKEYRQVNREYFIRKCKEYRAKNKSHVKKYLKNWNINNKVKRAKQFRKYVVNHKMIIDKYKETTPCSDCYGFYPAVCMDFDHINQKNKRGNVSQLIQRRKGLSVIWKEIAKCELVCSNCHRLRTKKRNQFKRLNAQPLI